MRRAGTRELPGARWGGGEGGFWEEREAGGKTWCSQQFVLNGLRMRDKPGAINSLLHSFSTIPLHLSTLSPSIPPRPPPCLTWTWSRGVFPALHRHGRWHVCSWVFKFRGPEPSVMEQVQEFSCTISMAVLAVAEMLLSDFCNIKS